MQLRCPYYHFQDLFLSDERMPEHCTITRTLHHSLVLTRGHPASEDIGIPFLENSFHVDSHP